MNRFSFFLLLWHGQWKVGEVQFIYVYQLFFTAIITKNIYHGAIITKNIYINVVRSYIVKKNRDMYYGPVFKKTKKTRTLQPEKDFWAW